MKPRLLILVILLFAKTASGGGWQVAGNGYYLSVPSDGWYYSRVVGQPYWYNGCYYAGAVSYQKVLQVPQKQVSHVTYSTNWKSDLLKAVERQKDNQLFLQALRESGLQGAATPLVQGSTNAYISGTQVYQQGYYQPHAEQGSTLFGLKAYTPNIGQVDIQGTLNQLSRLAEQQMTAADNVSYAFGEKISQISEGQLQLAKIQEAGRVAVALAQTAHTPKQVTTKFEARVGAGAYESARTSATSVPPGSNPPPPPVPDGTSDPQGGTVLPRVWVGELFRDACVKCHGPEKAKADLDLSNFANWSDDLLHLYGPKIAMRVSSHDPELQMPPPDSGIRALTPIEMKKVFAVLPVEEIPVPE